MGVRFKNDSYFFSIKKNESLSDENKIFEHAKQKAQFKYGEVTYQQFTKEYLANGWLGRKIIALPAAAWTAVVKTTYHLAKAIFIGIPTAVFDKDKYFKAQVFYIGRDFQEAFGRLISLFNDRYGQYHIQESQFHKSCYDCFARNRKGEKASLGASDALKVLFEEDLLPFRRHEVGARLHNIAEKTSLYDYRKKTPEVRKALFNHFYKKVRRPLDIKMSRDELDACVNQSEIKRLKELTFKDVLKGLTAKELKDS